jgi:hypothetical protein
MSNHTANFYETTFLGVVNFSKIPDKFVAG